MAKIRIEMTLPDEMFDSDGELTETAYNEIMDAVLPLGTDIDIEEI